MKARDVGDFQGQLQDAMWPKLGKVLRASWRLSHTAPT
jgi:hypothetical protein